MTASIPAPPATTSAPFPDTPLRRALERPRAARPTAAEALHAAKRDYLASRRVDMQSLARAMGVDRATLYRWVGSRENLLVELIWSLTQGTFAKLHEEYDDEPGPRAARILNGALRQFMGNAGHQAFLDREGLLALRLLTTKATGYQERFMALVEEVVEDDRRRGVLTSRVPQAELPFVLVRIIESYTYFALITGAEPNTERACRVIDALLPAHEELGAHE